MSESKPRNFGPPRFLYQLPTYRDLAMGSGLAILIAILVFCVAVIGAFVSWQQRLQRQRAMAEFAAELGWHFDPHHDSTHDDQYAHFSIFRRGHGRCAYNTMSGLLDMADESLTVKMGDFRYRITSGSGKRRSTKTYRLSYIILHLNFRKLPNLLSRAEGMFDKLAGIFGFDDIDFESADFSARFLVKSSDKKFAYDISHPRMMEFLLASDPPTVDIEHGAICLCDGRQLWAPEQFRTRLRWVQDFIALWPSHVTSTLQH